MFDGLKKKLSKFVDSFAKKEEEKMIEAAPAPQEVPIPVVQEHHKPVHHEPVQEPATHSKKEEKVKEHPKPEPTPVPVQHKEERVEAKPQITQPSVHKVHHPEQTEVKKDIPKVTTTTKLKGIFFREVKVKEEDVDPFMEELRMSLLQSDVNYEAAEKILENIRKGLVGKSLSSKGTENQISSVIKDSILQILNKKGQIDVIKLARSKKETGEPFKILFIGPNGAGKTTTMAKMAHLFMKNGFSCVLSASDTFRAAAIEQTVIHAGRLGIGVIKGTYGADPASVAFDAVAHAKAHRIDVVLIDSAGRQETNKSLMEEVKKMARVTKPDLKVFVGESISGNTLLNQVKEFNAAVGLDGVVLTKLDCDAKGGNTLSIISEADVPVLFFGLGERYEDLMPYSAEFIVDNLVGNN